MQPLEQGQAGLQQKDSVGVQPLLSAIDRLIEKGGRVVVAIDGMSAAGKSSLAAHLRGLYSCDSCNVITMDHFFLRQEQRTPERLAAPGGNIDYERFSREVIGPLRSGGAFYYRPFDCKMLEFSEPIEVAPKPLTVVEGVYSMHPSFADSYGTPGGGGDASVGDVGSSAQHTYVFSVFMRIDEELQRSRLLERNPALYERFVDEWLPMENGYFKHFRIQDKCDFTLDTSP